MDFRPSLKTNYDCQASLSFLIYKPPVYPVIGNVKTRTKLTRDEINANFRQVIFTCFK